MRKNCHTSLLTGQLMGFCEHGYEPSGSIKVAFLAPELFFLILAHLYIKCE